MMGKQNTLVVFKVMAAIMLVVALTVVHKVHAEQGEAAKPVGRVQLRQAQIARRQLTVQRGDPTTLYMLLGENSGSQTRALCYSRGRCFLKKLACPSGCPRRKPTTPDGPACFIDCSPAKCETSCRSRKAKCTGYGAVCYDPRFVGGDGVMFYFHGKANENFCLVSDPSLHINARFIGTRPEGRSRDYTWVQALGIMFDNHLLGIEAKRSAAWDDNVDHFSFSYDGQSLDQLLQKSSSWKSADATVLIERIDPLNSVNIIIDNLLEVAISVLPISEQENLGHNYQLNLTQDCFAHLDAQFKFMSLSPMVDGVLGQTYRPDYKNPVKVGVPMPIMGGYDKFHSSSLFKDDCRNSIFKTKQADVDSKLGETTLACSSTQMQGGGVLCKR